MRKSKIIISIILIITILGVYVESLAASFSLNVLFDGKNISMESETPEMSWDLDNFLPGNSDTSSITIRNGGKKTATVETTISIEEDTEEDNRLLEMIDLKITNKAGETVFTGKYTELKTIEKSLKSGESETYTAVTSLNVNAGNEYQNKQYKLKFNFKAIGEIPYGTLTVKYVDENGDDLEPPTVETKKITSEKYNLPETGKYFAGYHFDRVEGNITGEYKEEGTTVTYHYNKIKYGKLIVKYVDENGNMIPSENEEITTKEVGTEYTLNSTGKNIEGYRFEKVEGETTGNYTEEDTIVTYHYKKIKYGKLTERHIDEEGKILEQNQEIKEVETPYSLPSTGKQFDNYKFDRVEGNIIGKYTEGETVVTYYYNKIKYGKLIVKYVDKAGNVLEQNQETKETGTPYSLESVGKDIPGYTFEKVEGNLRGEYKLEDTIVTYIYNKIPEIKTGRLIIRYVDQDRKVLEEEIQTKQVGTPYKLNPMGKEIEGYDFVTIEGEYIGEYKENDTIVIYKYKKRENGKVIIRYVDENETTLEEVITTGIVDHPYGFSEEEIKKDIPGYDFKKIEGSLTGEYRKEDTIIYCRYEKIKYGKVIVRYVDENETILEEIVTTEKIRKPYNYTEEQIKKDIPEYEFKEIDGELTGEYKEEDTIIFCRYERIKYGRLIVVCIDENNNIIKRTVTTERVGTDYNLGKVGEEIEGYTFLGIEGEPIGKYKEEDIIVTYKYQKNKPQGPSTEEVTLPKTGQFIYIYIILGVVIVGLFLLLLLAKKRKKDDKIEDKKE